MPGKAIEGGCLCGAVRYRATSDPIARSLCHCRSCRLAAGAPCVAWVIFRSSEFAFITREPARFRSSPSVVRSFCSQCGTSLTYQREDEPQTIDTTTASLDVPDDFPPSVEIWLAHKIAWETANDTLPHHPGTSREPEQQECARCGADESAPAP